MESSLSAGHAHTRTYDLPNRVPLFRFFKTARVRNYRMKLASLRHLGVKALLLVDVLAGLWLASTYIYVFHALSGGGTVGEPDILVARAELWLSVGVTCWFLWQVPYWVLRLLREPRTPEAAPTANEDRQEQGK